MPRGWPGTGQSPLPQCRSLLAARTPARHTKPNPVSMQPNLPSSSDCFSYVDVPAWSRPISLSSISSSRKPVHLSERTCGGPTAARTLVRGLPKLKSQPGVRGSLRVTGQIDLAQFWNAEKSDTDSVTPTEVRGTLLPPWLADRSYSLLAAVSARAWRYSTLFFFRQSRSRITCLREGFLGADVSAGCMMARISSRRMELEKGQPCSTIQ